MRPDAVSYLDLTGLSVAQGVEWAVSQHPGIWAERKMSLVNALHHWEWYELELRHSRLAICAPRDHAKSECFSVATTAHHVIYRPGCWQYLFSDTVDQAQILLERVVAAVAQAEPWLLDVIPRFTTKDVVFANWSRVTVASVGKSIRGIHPDRIVGDDVLTEANTMTSLQRRRLEAWWFGTVGPMAHPGATRPMGYGKLKPRGQVPLVKHPPTRIVLVGTPFHRMDLLMQMASNPIYVFRRYAAVFDQHDLVPGTLAVEASGGLERVA